LERFTQPGVVLGVCRIEAAEHHGHSRLEARNWLVGRLRRACHRVTDLGIGDVLDGGGEPTDLAHPEALTDGRLRHEDADVVDLEVLARRDDPDLVLGFYGAVEDPDEGDYALVGVVDGVEYKRPQRPVVVALGGRKVLGYRLEYGFDVLAGLGRHRHGQVARYPDDLLELLDGARYVGSR